MDGSQLLCLPGQPVIEAGPERRASLENPAVSLADPDAMAEAFGWSLPTDAGQQVNTARTLSLSAVWAAVKMISGDTSRLPMQTFRRRPEGLRPIADDTHPVAELIGATSMANEEVSFLKLMRRVMVHALLYENGYIWIERANDGRVLGLYQLLSDRTITARKFGRQWVITEVGDETAGGSRLVARPASEVIHIEGLCIDGMAGCDMISQAREDIGVALASRQFKAKFFGDGMHSGGILQVPPGASQKATQAVQSAINEQHSGSDKAFRTLVLRDGFKWHSTQVEPERAQLTEIDESQIRDLCRRFMLAPGRLGVRNSISYNSLEMERRDYYDTTLSYWLSVIRSEFNTKLLTAQERRQWLIDYNVSLAILWADASTLITVATQGVNARDSGGRSIFESNEVRGWFGLPEREDGEQIESDETGGVAVSDEETDEEIESDGGSDGMEDEREAEADEPAGDQRAAVRHLMAAELGRLVRRWSVQAERAAKRGDTARWIGEYMDERQRQTSRDSIAAAVQVARSVCGVGQNAEAVASELWTRYAAGVAVGIERAEASAEELAQELIP